MNDFTFTFKDREYRIPGNKIIRTAGAVEEHLTLQELLTGIEKQSPPINKICLGFSALMKSAGAYVTPEEVREEIFKNNMILNNAVIVAQDLLMLMVPPEWFVDKADKKKVPDPPEETSS